MTELTTPADSTNSTSDHTCTGPLPAPRVVPALYTSYRNMVRNLAKPGEDILDSLTPQKVELWHHATGISTEVGEILENTEGRRSLDNYVEELGDLYFYAVGLANIAALPDLPQLTIYPTSSESSISTLSTELVIAASDILDQVKKCVVYNQDFDTPAGSIRLTRLLGLLYTLATKLDLDMNDIVNANRMKLADSDTARYADGYSDEAATVRADKAGDTPVSSPVGESE